MRSKQILKTLCCSFLSIACAGVIAPVRSAQARSLGSDYEAVPAFYPVKESDRFDIEMVLYNSVRESGKRPEEIIELMKANLLKLRERQQHVFETYSDVARSYAQRQLQRLSQLRQEYEECAANSPSQRAKEFINEIILAKLSLTESEAQEINKMADSTEMAKVDQAISDGLRFFDELKTKLGRERPEDRLSFFDHEWGKFHAPHYPGGILRSSPVFKLCLWDRWQDFANPREIRIDWERFNLVQVPVTEAKLFKYILGGRQCQQQIIRVEDPLVLLGNPKPSFNPATRVLVLGHKNRTEPGDEHDILGIHSYQIGPSSDEIVRLLKRAYEIEHSQR